MIKDMTHGSPLRLILGFALPMLAGMLFQQMYNLVDTMIVGRFLGVNALAGVGTTGSINFLVIGFCMGICAGFSIPVAQRFGAGEYRQMREYAANGALLSAVFAFVLTAVTVVCCRSILTAMNTPAECFKEAYDYISVIFAGIPFIVLYNLLSGYLRSLGDSRSPLIFLIISSVLNVALDLLLILTFDMGIMGASLATVISQAVSAMLCLLYIAVKVPMLHIRKEEWFPQSGKLVTLCGCGVPMGLQYSVTAIGSVILQTAINGLGAMSVAAVAASGKVSGFLGCPLDSLGSTMATYCAQNVGAKKHERLNKGLFTSSALGMVYSVLALLIAWKLGPVLSRLFITGEGGEQIIALAHRFLVINVVFYPLLVLVNTVRFSIQGMGYSVFAVIAGVMEMLARGIAGLLLVPVFGFDGAALGSPLAWVFADVFLLPAFFLCKRALEGRRILPQLGRQRAGMYVQRKEKKEKIEELKKEY